MTPMTCAELSESSAELALGIMSGPDRARALLHLQTCTDCRTEVEQLASISDALLELVPAADPPLGFEARVAARLAPPSRVRPRRWLPAAAAIITGLAVGAGGWAVGTAGRSPAVVQRPTVLASGSFSTASKNIGRVFLYGGRPTWVFMTVDSGMRSGVVTCLLTTRHGSSIRVGSFNLSDGYGYWGAPISADPGQITGARLVSAGGATLATATIRTG